MGRRLRHSFFLFPSECVNFFHRMEDSFPHSGTAHPLPKGLPNLVRRTGDKILLPEFPILLLFARVPLILSFSRCSELAFPFLPASRMIPEPEPRKIIPEIRMTKKPVVLPLVALFVLSFFHVLLDQAEARRLGEGRSFFSRPSRQRSAPQPQRSVSSQNQPAQPAQAAPASPATTPGGMLEGMVMGGLIGSLLFGSGFTGPGLLDLVVFGGLAFLLIRYLRARRTAAEGLDGDFFLTPPQGSHPGDRWNNAAAGSAGEPGKAPGPSIPSDFDQTDFIKGAKAVYARLQESWDRRDLEDIRQFISPEVWEEAKRQARADPHPSKTEIVLLNARLLDVKKTDGQTVASVLYDVLLRETPGQAETSRIREVWHFSRDDKEVGSFWVLVGIQQVESQN